VGFSFRGSFLRERGSAAFPSSAPQAGCRARAAPFHGAGAGLPSWRALAAIPAGLPQCAPKNTGPQQKRDLCRSLLSCQPVIFKFGQRGKPHPFGHRGRGCAHCRNASPSNQIEQDPRKIMTTVWSAIVLVLAAVITAVWIGVLGFGLMHLIEHAI
jgi:hypothetical protein